MRGLDFRQRSGLRAGSRQYTAGMGLRYNVPYDRDITLFFNDVEDRWNELLQPLAEEDVRPDTQERYLGRLTVAELRVSGAEARRHGVTWATNDAGRMRGKLLDGMARLRQDHGLPLVI